MLSRVSVAVHVPRVERCAAASVAHLADKLRGRYVSVLTGAGLSTESGIPDYRGEGTRRRARNPIQYSTFMESSVGRQRYWARSVIGWRRVSESKPNLAHRSLACLEAQSLIASPITQNVDRLHNKAGSERVIELHGALEEVKCVRCHRITAREELQTALLQRNPRFAAHTADWAPDGDADLSEELVRDFDLVNCEVCGGVLKPHVVFFGESVPQARVQAAFARVESSDALLVLGTSLAVFSGYRFARRAAQLGIPIFIINVGETRADPLAQLKIEGRVGDVVPRLAEHMLSCI